MVERKMTSASFNARLRDDSGIAMSQQIGIPTPPRSGVSNTGKLSPHTLSNSSIASGNLYFTGF